jgi:hypothetical protein
MTIRAVILVPAQGHHAQQFQWSARAVKSSVYGGRAIIVSTEVTAPKDINPTYQGLNNYQVKLRTEHGKPFAFGDHRNVSTMLTISHAAAQDGPNLAAGVGGYQPWAAYDPFGRDGNPYGGAGPDFETQASGVSCSTAAMACVLDAPPSTQPPRRPFAFRALRPAAQKFWSEVGRSLGAGGKIILVGCNLGRGQYIDQVANASGHPTYGANEACSAADVKTVVRLVKGIERGILFAPMRKATPEH